MWSLPFLERLAASERILIAGAGGGFDVYAGLPLALRLIAQGHQVFLGNLAITDLYALDQSVWCEPDIARVTDQTLGPGNG